MQRNSSGFNGFVAERTVNGLLYGHEETIEREIGSLQMITNEEMNIVASILEPYVQDRSLLRSLSLTCPNGRVFFYFRKVPVDIIFNSR